jgi:hypothetical protein
MKLKQLVLVIMLFTSIPSMALAQRTLAEEIVSVLAVPVATIAAIGGGTGYCLAQALGVSAAGTILATGSSAFASLYLLFHRW